MSILRRRLIPGLDVIHQTIAIQAHGDGRFRVGLLGQQQTLHIRVFDDGHLRLAEIRLVRMASLQTIASVIQRVAITPVTEHSCTKAHAHSRFIHHLEHVTQALVASPTR